MAKVRSPNYPTMDLAAALAFARKAYNKDLRNRMSRQALAKHLGHDNLTGPALTKIAALRAYGLIEGAGDELRITEEAVTAMMAPENSQERAGAMARLAFRPPLFQDIRKEFEGKVSEENLRYWLAKRAFTVDAATKAARAYLACVDLAGETGSAYTGAVPGVDDESDPPAVEAEVGDLIQVEIGGVLQLDKPRRVRAIREHQGEKWIFIEGSETGVLMSQTTIEQKGAGGHAPGSGLVPPRLPEERQETKPGMQEEKNRLDEGEAVLTWPGNLSAESVRDLEYWLTGILNKAKRRAGIVEGAPSSQGKLQGHGGASPEVTKQ